MDISFLSATILLILITDPLGNVPMFIAALKQVREDRHQTFIYRECAIAFGVLLLFMIFGKGFLGLLHLSDEALKVAGGVVLFIIALRMIFPGGGPKLGEVEDAREPFIVPVAIPLIAGPSAMATAMLLSSGHPGKLASWIGALAIAILVTLVVFLLATRLQKLVGEPAILATERLMGLLLTAVAIEMLLGGVRAYFSRNGM